MDPGAGVVYPGAGYLSTLGPQLAAAVAGPVRILPQYESFYANPKYNDCNFDVKVSSVNAYSVLMKHLLRSKRKRSGIQTILSP